MHDRRLTLFVAASLLVVAFPALRAPGDSRDEAAPPPPADVLGEPGWSAPAPRLFAAKDGTTEYVHGDPTDEEQRFLWLMNRARLDPSAEADRILVDYNYARITSSVDFFLNDATAGDWTRQENHDAFDGYLRQPPFALNADLLANARVWSQHLKDTNAQEHPADLGQYFTDAGYVYASAAQSVYSYAADMLHAHAAFAVDWGQPIDAGSGRAKIGHRSNLMNPGDTDSKDYREVGVGVVQDNGAVFPNVGPRIVTCDFARPIDHNIRFVTGVCFVDQNDNDEYDEGEGVAGVRIDVDSSSFYAITSESGGYAVPIDKADGEVEVVTTPTADTRSLVIGSQAAIGDTFEIDPAGGNVHMDFGLPPEAPPSDTSSFTVSGGTTQDGATVEKTFSVGLFDVGSPTLGDVDLSIDLTHPDRSELLVELVSPEGTVIVLFDGANPGADLVGSFGDTLVSRDPLDALLGELYTGDWKLRVTDAAGGGVGTFGDCTLTLGAAWIRSTYAPRSGLFVKKVKFKEADVPAKDAVTLKAEVDVGVLMTTTIVERASLVVRGVGAGFPELFSVDLSQVPVPAAKLVPTKVKLKAKVNHKSTSKAVVTVSLKGLDLPALPDQVRIDLALGDVIVSQQVALVNGAYAGKKTPSLDRQFRVEKLVSKDQFGVNVTTVKGRFYNGGSPLPFEGLIEFSLGSFAEKRDISFFTAKGVKHIYAGIQLSKLVVNPVTGTFSAKVISQEPVLEDGKVRVTLRIGDFLGATEFVPNTAGTKIKY